MASYFALPVQDKAAPTNLDNVPDDTKKQLGKMSLLSPQVSRILEDMDQSKSDDSSEEGSLSDEASVRNADKPWKPYESQPKTQRDKENKPHIPSTLSQTKTNTNASSKGVDHDVVGHYGSSQSKPQKPKPKQPHMARFHSLRSLLFLSKIEDKMKTATPEDLPRDETAAGKWNRQHAERQMHRPGTPEKDDKEGMTGKIKTRLRRMTSKDAPTMEQISEDEPAAFGSEASTASDADDDFHRRYRDDDEESIKHSDVEDLVRWVSRRDPPSDGEGAQRKCARKTKSDGGHESLGNSDVDDLVRWISHRGDASTSTRKDHGKHDKHGKHLEGLSDASTASGSEYNVSSSDEENVDELTQWISRRDGRNTGPTQQPPVQRAPVQRKLQDGDFDWEEGKHYDSDVPDLKRWGTRHDDTSGDDSDVEMELEQKSKKSKDVGPAEPERGRPRSRGTSPAASQGHMSDDDVDEILRWVSRREVQKRNEKPPGAEGVFIDDDINMQKTTVLNKLPTPETGDLRHSKLNEASSTTVEHSTSAVPDRSAGNQKIQDDESKKGELGMTKDKNAPSQTHIQEVSTHAEILTPDTAQPQQQTETKMPDPAAQQLKADDEAKKEQLGITMDNGSLSQSDLEQVLTHAKSLHHNTPAPQPQLSSSTRPAPTAIQHDDDHDAMKAHLGIPLPDEEGSLSQGDLKQVLSLVKNLHIEPPADPLASSAVKR